MQLSTLLVWALFEACTAAAQDNTTILQSPDVIRPSGSWDGVDGPWASFSMIVGSDGAQSGQVLRTFPGFSFSILLVPVAANFCSGTFVLEETCVSRSAFHPNTSSWKSLGDISILTVLGLARFLLGDSEAMHTQQYGTYDVGMGTRPGDYKMLQEQAVAGIASTTFFMGLFGLSNTSLNLGGQMRKTLLTNFAGSNAIPCKGFSYTAGSFTKNSTPPSLVLGGYDSSRFDSGTTLQVETAQASSSTTPFYVNLTDITFAGSDKVWRNGSVDSLGSVAVCIDSALSHIWLPMSACQVFEEVLSLEWNETAQLYLINSTEHDRLKQLNATVTFSLHSSRLGSAVKNFTLPYSAFDLKIAPPLVDTESYYFPLKRAYSPDQYMLGRTFLQETHISVDYEAAYFNISQAVSGKGEEKIETIVSPSTPPSHLSPPSNNPKGTPGPKRLSTGAYAGIGVGTSVIVVGILVLAWRKQWPFKKTKPAGNEGGQYDKAELQGQGVPMVGPVVEAMGKETVELEANEAIHEVNNVRSPLQEVQGSTAVYELYAESLPSALAADGNANAVQDIGDGEKFEQRVEDVDLL